MIFKLLYRWFPKSYAKQVFLDQKKPTDFTLLKQKFIDSEGRKYYSWDNVLDIPISRKGHFEKCFKELEYGLSGAEMDGIITAMESAIQKRDRVGNMQPDIAMLGWLIKEIRDRKENLIHPDILMDMVACLYVREDELSGKFDQEIHNQKLEQFKKDVNTGLYDFFFTAGLSERIPCLKNSGEDWETIFMVAMARAKTLQTILGQYSTEKE